MSIFNENDIENNANEKLTLDFINEHCLFQYFSGPADAKDYKGYDMKSMDGIVYLSVRGAVFIDTSDIPPFIKISAQSTISVTVCGPVVDLDFLDSGCIDALQLVGARDDYPYNCTITSNNTLHINSLLLDGFTNGVSLDICEYTVIERMYCYYSKITKLNTKHIQNIELDNMSAQCMIEYLLNEKFNEINKFNVNVIK